MSVKQTIIDNVFGGRPNILDNVIVQYDSATSPDGVVTAALGTLLYVQYYGDDSNKDVYINTDASTAWTQIHNDV